MHVSKCAELTGLTERMVRYLVKHGFVREEPDEEGLRFMRALSVLCRREAFMKLAVSHFSMAQRADIFFASDLSKVERYIFTRLSGLYAQGERGVNLEAIVDEALGFYRIPAREKGNIMKAARRVRNRIHVMRSRGHAWEDIWDLMVEGKAAKRLKDIKTQKKKSAGGKEPQRQGSGNAIFGY